MQTFVMFAKKKLNKNVLQIKKYCKVRDHCRCLGQLNLKEITDMKKLGKYHDLYIQNVTLLLANLLENFQNMSFEMNELDPACFLTTWVSLASSLYNEHRDIEHFIEPDVQYPEKMHGFHNDLTFLSEGIKIQKNQKSSSQLG